MSKKLSEYERKRNRKKTPEPFGGKRGKAKAPIFVVQRHDARRLHYDFRLERDGVLASWAVPKGVPLEPGEQHLAVHVEDHPLEYASFEGEIPQGNYGAGTVEIWDHGTYELVEEKPDGGLTVRLHGERLEGTWTLVPAHLSGDEKNWLILRKRDERAPRPRGPARVYRPMLATLTEKLPHGEGWLFEPKWDGYRALGYVRGGEAKLLSRRGNDLTQRFAVVAKELAEGAADARRRRRRRGLRARRAGPAELLGDAAGQAGHARLRGLRSARGRRRAAGRPAADRAARAARAAVRSRTARRPALRRLRRRRGAVRGGEGAGPRGRHGQALVVPLPRKAAAVATG